MNQTYRCTVFTGELSSDKTIVTNKPKVKDGGCLQPIQNKRKDI